MRKRGLDAMQGCVINSSRNLLTIQKNSLFETKTPFEISK